MRELITELERTSKFIYFLFYCVEQELNLLSAGIAPESKTARAFKLNATWGEIAEAARADSRLYDDCVYNDIANLAAAAESAWRRCNRVEQEVACGLSGR